MNARDIHEGMKVHARDGANLGKVVEMSPESFIIEKGFFFPKEYVARYTQIDDIRDDEIWLHESETDLRAGGGELREEGRREDTGRIEGSREEVVVPLASEELETETRRHEAGGVRVRKGVETEEHEIEVPVRREEVHVERVAASGDAGEATFEEGETRIPIYEEEVEVTTRPVVREELRVSKTASTETESVRAKTRRETADVEEEKPRREEHRHPR